MAIPELRLSSVAYPRGWAYSVRARCDWLDEYLVDVFAFRLDTSSLSEALIWAENEFSNHTIVQIERTD